MLNKYAILSTLGAALMLQSLTTLAGPIEDQIKFRQSAYSFIGWNTNKIKTQLDNPDTFSKDEVVAAANAIAAAANSGLGALYGPGTDKGEGWRKSRLKSEFFDKPEEAKKAALQFNLEANEFAKVAGSGDVGQIKAKFGKLTQSCKSCHDSFREKDVK